MNSFIKSSSKRIRVNSDRMIFCTHCNSWFQTRERKNEMGMLHCVCFWCSAKTVQKISPLKRLSSKTIHSQSPSTPLISPGGLI